MENVISKTLFIPLVFRAVDAKSKNSVLNDKTALELVENKEFTKNFDIDVKSLKKASFSQAGTMVRANYFDKKAKEFIKNNPRPVVVNMATGLDTRTLRIYDKKAKFYDIDLSEVVDIRKKYIKDKSTVLSADVFGKDYISELLKNENSQFCFIYEGFFPYFGKKEIEIAINNVVNSFQGSLLGDFNFGDFWEKNQNKHDAMKTNSAKFKTSFQTLQELLSVNKKLKLKDSKFFYDKDFGDIWGWRRYVLMLLPKRARLSRLLELGF